MVDGLGTTAYTYASGGELATETSPFANSTVTSTYVNRLRTALSRQQPTGSWTNLLPDPAPVQVSVTPSTSG